MLPAAGALLLALLVLVVVVPGRLAAAGWCSRAPALAVLLWQALGLATVVLVVEVALTVALAPAGDSHLQAARRVLSGDAGLPWWGWALAVAAVALAGRLAGGLAVQLARTVLDRRRHLALVDLVTTRNPLLADARVVDAELPVAYCVPGLRPRVVLSRGALRVLTEDEVRAVLAHEAAHVDQRHDLVVLPFLALGSSLGSLAVVRTAADQVALLVEMLADDRAVRRHDRLALARALLKVGSGVLPRGGLGAAGSEGVLRRARRLLEPQAPLSRTARVAVVAAVVLVLGVPPAGLVLPVALG